MKISHILDVSTSLSLLLALGLSLDCESVCAQTRAKRPAQAASAQPQKASAPKAAPNPTPTPAQTPETNAADSAASDGAQLTPEEQTKYNEALANFKKQDFNGALEALRELTAGNPAARPPRLIMARWFMELKNMQAVRISFEMATEENPNDPEAYFSLAEIALSEGALTSAELLVAKGDQVLAKYNANEKRKAKMIGLSYRLKLAYSNARNRWDEAQSAVLGLIKTEGESAELDRAYARVLFLQNQDDKARDMFARADKLAKEGDLGLPADAAMAQLYASRGDAENAKRSMDAALKANPKSTPVLLLSISNALTENDLDAAWKLVQQMYQSDKSAEVVKTYGKVALFRSDYQRAEVAFQEVVRQNPLDADAAGGLALALCEQGDAEKCQRAVQYAAGNVQKQSNNRDFLATFGWTLYKSGQVDDALKILQQSVADGQVNAAAAYYFAVILNEKNQPDAAKQLLAAALSTKQPFAKREAANQLFQQLGGAAQQ